MTIATMYAPSRPCTPRTHSHIKTQLKARQGIFSISSEVSPLVSALVTVQHFYAQLPRLLKFIFIYANVLTYFFAKFFLYRHILMKSLYAAAFYDALMSTV